MRDSKMGRLEREFQIINIHIQNLKIKYTIQTIIFIIGLLILLFKA